MLLEINGLEAGYGKNNILNNINIEVDKGKYVALIGPNGAGKTTLFNCIYGILKSRNGKIGFKGHDITNKNPKEVLRLGISYVPEGKHSFGHMNIQENLEMGGYIRNDKKVLSKEIEKLYEVFPILKDKKERLAKHLSGGEHQIMAMARAFLLQPELMLIDEPSLGLAPRLVKYIFEQIRNVYKAGTTIFLVEQNPRLALEHADYAYILDVGEIRFEGTAQELLNNPKVQEVYLGE